jgi:hypothetical protein
LMQDWRCELMRRMGFCMFFKQCYYCSVIGIYMGELVRACCVRCGVGGGGEGFEGKLRKMGVWKVCGSGFELNFALFL